MPSTGMGHHDVSYDRVRTIMKIQIESAPALRTAESRLCATQYATCLTCAVLMNAWKITNQEFTTCIEDLAEAIGTVPECDYDFAHAKADRARIKVEDARHALEEHWSKHRFQG